MIMLVDLQCIFGSWIMAVLMGMIQGDGSLDLNPKDIITKGYLNICFLVQVRVSDPNLNQAVFIEAKNYESQ